MVGAGDQQVPDHGRPVDGPKGTFFTPEAAPFSLSGGSPLSQQNPQFITYQLAVSGGAQLTMSPQPNQAISYLPPKAVLIR